MGCSRCRRTKTYGTGMPTDFCSVLSFSTPVALNDSLVPEVQTFDQRMTVPKAIEKYGCKTSATKLSEIVMRCLGQIKANGHTNLLQDLKNRNMPLLMLKDRLFKLCTKCSSCKGAGCTSCNTTGVA